MWNLRKRPYNICRYLCSLIRGFSVNNFCSIHWFSKCEGYPDVFFYFSKKIFIVCTHYKQHLDEVLIMSTLNIHFHGKIRIYYIWVEKKCLIMWSCGDSASWSGPSLSTHMIRPRGYKTFFMLNSAEHEIFSANKYENANNIWHFHIYKQRKSHAQLCLARIIVCIFIYYTQRNFHAHLYLARKNWQL